MKAVLLVALNKRGNMSNIHYIVLIVALWAICSIVISIFKSEKEYQKRVKELEKWREDKLERDLTTWESLKKNN